ncbi:TonB-dependent receptor [Campylobacter blaseri]|uniref:TonB-dependent receptor n=1 Tax=Campylobacter blaseri TaxID=2042961 RepID=A0A2P8QZ10_9BACT|nr:TonB-dependent receptor [Campylobacter blaseri]PSM51490.1 hypothetical protein CQ405_07955 [Campylobacter blaseri]PSM52939.1 hypothetical protein CRN67_07960 [Campylobacter blaseri]QKF86501.1 TonB-dependent receptor [Campylobacter blaseri]
MYKITKISILTCMVLSYANALEQVKLDKVEAEANDIYIKSKAISTKKIEQGSTQNLDDIVRSVPGAFTNLDKSSGTININIRGVSGFGRVNTMVDGVSQTFYTTSADGGAMNGGTASFGTMIDPGFLNSVDIERGSFSGRGGANSLMGSANLRTIGVDDIVRAGRNFGFMTNFIAGNNATGPNYLGAVAFKHFFENGAYVGGLYGYSHRKISQSYEVGGGDKIEGETFKFKKFDKAGDAIYEDSKGREYYSKGKPPYNPSELSQKPKGNLAKVEYGDEYNKVILSYRDYKTSLAGRSVENNNYQLEYNLKSPNSDNIDLNLIYALNTGEQDYTKGARFTGVELLENLKTKNTARTFDISNTFSNDFNSGANLKTTIGMNILKNKYTKSRHPSELNFKIANNSAEMGIGLLKNGYETNTLYPAGEQEFNTFYIDNELNYDIFTFSFNANWSKYNFTGERFERLDRLLANLRQKANSAFRDKDYDSARKYNKMMDDLNAKHCGRDEYGYSNYCDDFYLYKGKLISEEEYDDLDIDEQEKTDKYIQTANEKLFDSGSRRYFNYSLGTSVYLHDLFSPFINYSKTHRAPNIKEMFFSDFGSFGVNSSLKPETAKTIQVGFNSFKEGLFSEDDEFGFKFIAYNTKIKDYIHNKKGMEYQNEAGEYYIKHYNYHKDVTIKGFEVEANYDIGWLYLNLAYAHQTTNQPLNFTDSSPRVDDLMSYSEKWLQGYGLTKVTMLPKDYASLDIGTRLFNNKLTIGGITKYYGKSRISSNTLEKVPCPGTMIGGAGISDVCGYTKKEKVLERQPVIFDFYTIYQPNENLSIKFEIQNFFDKKYINPLDSNNDSASQFLFDLGVGDDYLYASNNYAKGRTTMLSFSYKY